MGSQNIDSQLEAEKLRTFVRQIINDVRALEFMLANDKLETGVRRIGAEQELCIVDNAWRPALKALEILELIDDPHFATEIGLFNLEFNLDPLVFSTDCLAKLEGQVNELLAKAEAAAEKLNTAIVLTGILPTLRKSDLGLLQMTPKPRYYALNEAFTRLRGDAYEMFLRGADELYVKHDSIMLEACNTSFQIHFQVEPHEFARYYNIAQAIAGPVLAAAVNSPLLFGKRLWQETRIAVFQQAVDTRQPHFHLRESMARVSFGNGWVKNSILEIFQEDIARFRVLLAANIDEDPFEALQQGRVPTLRALQTFNSTVYRWNRPCYGITDGKPHLRIENRLFPAGPTPLDEIANGAFWLGLINGMAATKDDISTMLDFDDVRGNFVAAARQGLKAQFTWIENRTISAQELIVEQLLPLAREGLQQAGIFSSHLDRYLEIIKARALCGQTGAEWLTRSFAVLKTQGSTSECLSSLTSEAFHHMQEGKPVHEWAAAQLNKKSNRMSHFQHIEQYMSTDLLTVREDDTIDLVINIMAWRRIRHIPVEDDQNYFIGIINYRSLLQLLQSGFKPEQTFLPVSAILQKNTPTVTPTSTTVEAIALMREKGETCLPVVLDGRLVGIVTQNDFMNIAAYLLEQ